jgi:hypothetical protein
MNIIPSFSLSKLFDCILFYFTGTSGFAQWYHSIINSYGHDVADKTRPSSLVFGDNVELTFLAG